LWWLFGLTLSYPWRWIVPVSVIFGVWLAHGGWRVRRNKRIAACSKDMMGRD
jgi:hypothetical protein